MRKVYIDVKFSMVVEMEEGIEVSEVMDELDYTLYSMTDNTRVIDTQMLDYDVTDSV